MRELAFRLYMLFLVSFFLHLPARFHVLGEIRIDLLLVAAIAGLIFLSRDQSSDVASYGKPGKLIGILVVYIVITLPLVQWPGSVLNTGLTGFIKAVIFYYFTVSLVTTENKLKILVGTFLFCQIIRVIEPLYLNITEGYWGSRTYVGSGEFADRLAGAPSDIINPNELSYVIIVLVILIYYLFINHRSFLIKLFSFAVIGACTYALILTASRSGFLVFAIVGFLIFRASKRKFLYILVASFGVLLAISNLSDFQRDRYLSIFSSDTKGAATSQGRITGLSKEFEVALKRPIVGHGLGTSREAMYKHFGKAQISHNLYIETIIEIGFIGFMIYLLFLKTILTNLLVLKEQHENYAVEGEFMTKFSNALFIWAIATLIFSFAQYGLSIYAIYFIAGLAVASQTVLAEKNYVDTHQADKKITVE